MKQNDNFERKDEDATREIGDKIMRFGAIMLALAVILACFSYTKIEGSGLRIALFVLAGLLGAFGLFIMLVIGIGTRAELNRTNFFLYDRRTRQNISPSELTVSEVRRRITCYMAAFKHRGRLYVGELFDERSISDHFKTLFCYELLCQIAEEGGQKAEIFLSYGPECSDIFSGYLLRNEDYDLANRLRGFAFDFSEHKDILDEFTSYLSSKKDYLESKILGYTVDHIDNF